MNITAAKTRPADFKMPEYSVLVKTEIGDLVVREVANSANLIVHVVTTMAGAFVGNVNETWRGRIHHFCVVTPDGLRKPEAHGGLVEATKSLAKAVA